MATNVFTHKMCLYIVLALSLIMCGLIWFSNRQYKNTKRLIEEIEYYDSLGQYNSLYYAKTFKELKKENKELYDSLKIYKDKIDYIVQFTHEKDYGTGNVTTKPNIIDSIVYDTVPITVDPIARTYEYVSEPNDTFQYKLDVNSFTEPNWYSIQAHVKNKFTIVNKEEGGMNHITIGSENGGTIGNATTYKKDNKKKFWDKVSVGPSVTAGYDVVNRQWGVMVGASVSYNLK